MYLAFCIERERLSRILTNLKATSSRLCRRSWDLGLDVVTRGLAYLRKEQLPKSFGRDPYIEIQSVVLRNGTEAPQPFTPWIVGRILLTPALQLLHRGCLGMEGTEY